MSVFCITWARNSLESFAIYLDTSRLSIYPPHQWLGRLSLRDSLPLLVCLHNVVTQRAQGEYYACFILGPSGKKLKGLSSGRSGCLFSDGPTAERPAEMWRSRWVCSELYQRDGATTPVSSRQLHARTPAPASPVSPCLHLFLLCLMAHLPHTTACKI